MRALLSVFSILGSVISALRYELARLRGVRSLRGVVLSAMASSVILTLLAARRMIGLAHSLPWPPHPSHVGHSHLSYVSELLSQYTPTHGGGAWVVAGGVVGMVLPGVAAAWGAAWFGATSIGCEYRSGGVGGSRGVGGGGGGAGGGRGGGGSGGGLLTFVLVPRRGSVLVAKVVVAAGLGALLCVGTTAVAYGTARLGFRVTGTHVALPLTLLVPGPRAVALAALGGALGVFGGAVLWVRVLATVSALTGCSLVAAFLPRSTSLAIPYLVKAAQHIVHVVPGVTYASVMDALLTLPLAAMVLSGLVAVRWRRVV